MVTEPEVRAAIACVIDHVDAQGIDAGADFYDCDLDSLHHASIILQLQEMYGLTVADGDLDKCRSITAIISYSQNQADG